MGKHRAFTLWEILVVIAVIMALSWLLFPVLTNLGGTPYPNKYRSACQSNLKRIGLAFAQYNNDYDGKFPLASRPEGWVGLLQPYVNDKEASPFVCPSDKLRAADNLTDYWFNRRLADVETKNIANMQWTLLSGDGEESDDPNVSLAVLPLRWSAKAEAPARRHLDGANYGFADGHVKWFKPEKITLDKPSANRPTFLVR